MILCFFDEDIYYVLELKLTICWFCYFFDIESDDLPWEDSIFEIWEKLYPFLKKKGLNCGFFIEIVWVGWIGVAFCIFSFG